MDWKALRQAHGLTWGQLLSVPEVQRHMGNDAASSPVAALFVKVGDVLDKVFGPLDDVFMALEIYRAEVRRLPDPLGLGIGLGLGLSESQG